MGDQDNTSIVGAPPAITTGPGGLPPTPAGYAPGSPQMQYTIAGAEGSTSQHTEHDLMGMANQAGFKVSGVTPDGLNFTTPSGSQPISSVLKNNGANVVGMKPLNPNYTKTDPSMAFGVQEINSPDLKKAFLQHSLNDPQAQVIGSGDDWYSFDPQAKQWTALTKAPGVHMSDLARYAPAAGQAIGAAAEGAAMAPAGPAAMGAGAFLGAESADALMRAGFAAMNPAFRATATLPDQAASMVGNIPGNAIGAAIPAGLQAYGSPVLGLAKGAISQSMQKIGGGLAKFGTPVGEAAGAVARSPFGTEIAAGLVPGGATAQIAQMVGNAPKSIIKDTPGLLDKIISHPWIRPLLGDQTAEGLSQSLKEVQKFSPDQMLSEETSHFINPDMVQDLPIQKQPIGKAFNDRMMGNTSSLQSEEVPASRIGANIGGRLSVGRMTDPNIAAKTAMQSEQELTQNLLKQAVHKGANTDEIDMLLNYRASEEEEAAQKAFMDQQDSNTVHFNNGRTAGYKTGQAASGAADLSNAVAAPVQMVAKAGLRTIQGAGNALGGTGRIMQGAGNYLQPYEPTLESMMGVNATMKAYQRKQLGGNQ